MSHSRSPDLAQAKREGPQAMQAAKDAQRSPDAKETQSMEQAIGRLFGIAYFRSLAALLALAAYHFFRWPTTWYQWRRLRWQWRWCSQ